MKKNTKLAIILAAAIAMAIIAGILTFVLLTPERATVYIFNDSYAEGTRLNGNMFSVVELDSKAIINGASGDIGTQFITKNEIGAILQQGYTLKYDVTKGVPLTLSLLSVSGGNTIETSMKPTAVAITVAVDSITGVTPDLSKNAYVNVFAAYKNGERKLLLESIRVLKTHYSSSGSLVGVTLEAENNTIARALIVAQTDGVIYLGLVNPSGYVFESYPEDQEEYEAQDQTNEDATILDNEESTETDAYEEDPDNGIVG